MNKKYKSLFSILIAGLTFYTGTAAAESTDDSFYLELFKTLESIENKRGIFVRGDRLPSEDTQEFKQVKKWNYDALDWFNVYSLYTGSLNEPIQVGYESSGGEGFYTYQACLYNIDKQIIGYFTVFMSKEYVFLGTTETDRLLFDLWANRS